LRVSGEGQQADIIPFVSQKRQSVCDHALPFSIIIAES
jgi:hypothetical protein